MSGSLALRRMRLVLLVLVVGLIAPSAALANTEVADASCQGAVSVTYQGSRQAESFTAQNSGLLTRATVQVVGDGSTAVNYRVSIRTLDGTGKPTSTVLASADIPNVIAPNDFTGYKLNAVFATPPAVTAGQFYAVSVEALNAANVRAGVQVNNVCPGALFFDPSANDSWANGATGNDMLMGIFVTVPGPTPSPSPSPTPTPSPPAPLPAPPVPPAPPAAPVTTSPDNGLIAKGTTNLGFPFGVDVRVRVPGSGVIDASAVSTTTNFSAARAAKAYNPFVIAQTRRVVTAAGSYRLRLTPTAAARKLLKKTGKLKARLAITFTPRGGKPKTIRTNVTFYGPLKRKPKHHGS